MKSSIVDVETSTRGVSQPMSIKAANVLSRHTQWRLYTFSLLANDWIMILVAFRLAFYLRFNLDLPIFRTEVVPRSSFYSELILLLTPIWLLIYAGLGLYNRHFLLGGTEEYSRVLRGTTFGMIFVIIAGFLQPGFIIARGWLILAWVLSFLLTIMGRFWLRRVIYGVRQYGYFLSPTLIVGANEEGISLARQLLSGKNSGLDVIGFCDKKLPVGKLVCGNLQVVSKMEQLDQAIKKFGIEELVLATSAISTHDNIMEIFRKYGISSDINVRMSSGLYEIITTGLSVKEFAYVPLVTVNKVRLTGPDRFLKLLLDYTLTIPGIILLSPFLLVIVIMIKLDSPGPVIHRRRVMGVNNRQFDAYKFRTMYINGDEILASHPELQAELEKNHKLKVDPRITRIGKFLRKYSLDELPQSINVLKRDMSIVGPRMICPEEMLNYSQWGLNLLTIRPGITGLWQVSGRSDISYAERVRLDMHYIRNWSIWLDLQLLIRTIPAVIKGKGAY